MDAVVNYRLILLKRDENDNLGLKIVLILIFIGILDHGCNLKGMRAVNIHISTR